MQSLGVSVPLLCLVLAASVARGFPWGQCQQGYDCRLPECFCPTFSHPMPPHLRPMIVYFGFDDAVTVGVAKYYRHLFSSDRRNPNGCPITMSLYVSHYYTDYGLVKEFYEAGHEIGVHSVTHTDITTGQQLRVEGGERAALQPGDAGRGALRGHRGLAVPEPGHGRRRPAVRPARAWLPLRHLAHLRAPPPRRQQDLARHAGLRLALRLHDPPLPKSERLAPRLLGGARQRPDRLQEPVRLLLRGRLPEQAGERGGGREVPEGQLPGLLHQGQGSLRAEHARGLVPVPRLPGGHGHLPLRAAGAARRLRGHREADDGLDADPQDPQGPPPAEVLELHRTASRQGEVPVPEVPRLILGVA